ncbi:hypothetical protein [Cryptosporangium arvum]|uniref:Uncharacterized protein n=1 Tax=Cryptosporangium arvum DSM 44712 TaxID=927661 RepID=A0A010YH24_9ACTN|nr:hypothetical protein [Cryptosporangium arvum]EXG79575.1 hypothetical protein CryarDRAFT_0616 [Cryptosporangium arvum DSM 44712]
MVLFVTMVVLAVAVATTVTVGQKRTLTALAVTGGALWTAAAAGLALMSGVPPLLLALVGASLAYAVHHLTRRALATRDDGLPNALLLFSRRRATRIPAPIETTPTDITLTLNTIRVLDAERSRREPLHWSVVAATGIAATALEGYWAYQHLIAGGGVFSDLAALAGFAVLATLTVAGTGVAGLAVHMRTTPRPDSAPQSMPAPSDMETIAFTPITVGTTGRFGRRRPRATAGR